VRILFFRVALLSLAALPLSACGGAAGSCLFTQTAASGYDFCEDFLGSEFNASAAQNACAGGDGAWSSDPCTTAGALGACAIGSGAADDFRYTYYAAPGGSPPSAATLESACGVAGGTFTAG